MSSIRTCIFVWLSLSLFFSCKKPVEVHYKKGWPLINEKIFSIMKEWYYWNNTIPSDKDMSVYSTPQDAINALKYKTIDKWSFVETKQQYNDYFFSSKAIAYGFCLSRLDNGTVVTSRIAGGSPAEIAGLRVGYEVTRINGRSVSNITDLASLYPRQQGETITLQFIDSTGHSRERIIVSELINTSPVSFYDVYERSGIVYGYIVVNSFVSTTPSKINEAFNLFQSKHVRRLIIDFRNNGGGLVSGAKFLLEKIAPPNTYGNVMYYEEYNAQKNIENTRHYFENTSPLDLDVLFFLTSHNTASASEMVINCIKPYMPGKVFQIGGTTHGKPVGMGTYIFDEWAVSPIMFSIYNSQHIGNYFSGIVPDRTVRDNYVALGDTTESLLNTALNYFNPSQSKSGNEPVSSTRVQFSGMRSLVNMY